MEGRKAGPLQRGPAVQDWCPRRELNPRALAGTRPLDLVAGAEAVPHAPLGMLDDQDRVVAVARAARDRDDEAVLDGRRFPGRHEVRVLRSHLVRDATRTAEREKHEGDKQQRAENASDPRKNALEPAARAGGCVVLGVGHRLCRLGAEHLGEVRRGALADRLDAEGVDEDLQDVGGDERGKCGAKPDVRDPEVQERQ